MNPPLDENWELVHEGQRYKGDLSIETFFGKCSVLICNTDEVPFSCIGRQKKNWVFFCRFGLGPKNSKSFISVKESEMKQNADLAAKSIAEAEGNKCVNGISTPSRLSSRSRKLSENEENESNNGQDSIIKTPRSSKRIRNPPRILEETLPSPLKNAKFSISSTKTKELCIVIQRCNFSPKKEGLNAQAEEIVKVKARKKLDLESTPTKVSQNLNCFKFHFITYLLL